MSKDAKDRVYRAAPKTRGDCDGMEFPGGTRSCRSRGVGWFASTFFCGNGDGMGLAMGLGTGNSVLRSLCATAKWRRDLISGRSESMTHGIFPVPWRGGPVMPPDTTVPVEIPRKTPRQQPEEGSPVHSMFKPMHPMKSIFRATDSTRAPALTRDPVPWPRSRTSRLTGPVPPSNEAFSTCLWAATRGFGVETPTFQWFRAWGLRGLFRGLQTMLASRISTWCPKGREGVTLVCHL